MIEDNIPIPPERSSGKYGFRRMEIGQSITVPITGEFLANGKRPEYNRLRAAASTHGRRHGVRFTIRILPEEGVIRCWRVS